MRKLLGISAVLALTVLAALPSAAQPWIYYCDQPSDCPDIRDCWVSGCINHICEYSCWW